MLPAFCWVLCDSMGSWDCGREEGTMRIRGFGENLEYLKLVGVVTDQSKNKMLAFSLWEEMRTRTRSGGA